MVRITSKNLLHKYKILILCLHQKGHLILFQVLEADYGYLWPTAQFLTSFFSKLQLDIIINILVLFESSNFIIKKQMKTILNLNSLQYRGKHISDQFSSQFVQVGQTNYFYHPKEMIGRGSFGQVMLGYAKQLHKLVAIKVIPIQGHTHNSSLNRLKAQIQALQQIDSKNLIKYINHFFTAETCYIVTQLYQQSLREYINKLYKKSGGVQHQEQFLKKILMLIHGIIAGLLEIHSKGFTHRDLKTDNVLIGSDNAPKIIDFGFCTKVDILKQKNSEILGTLPYMAPEAIQVGHCSPQTDIWSLGIIIYQILFGKIPFPIYNLNFEECYKIISAKKTQMEANWKKQKKASQRSQLLKNLILKCLKFKQHQRGNCQELLNFLETENMKILQQQQVAHTIIVNPTVDNMNNKSIKKANDFLEELYLNLESFKHLKTFSKLQQMIAKPQQSTELFHNNEFKNNLISCLKKLMAIIGNEEKKGFDKEKKLIKQLQILFQAVFAKENIDGHLKIKQKA